MPCKHKYFNWLSVHQTESICSMSPPKLYCIYIYILYKWYINRGENEERIKRDCLPKFYSQHLHELFVRTNSSRFSIIYPECLLRNCYFGKKKKKKVYTHISWAQFDERPTIDQCTNRSTYAAHYLNVNRSQNWCSAKLFALSIVFTSKWAISCV